MGLRRASHAVYGCEYHLVWCPKYRKKLFGQEYLRKRAKELFREIAEEYEFIIEELEVAADHVHILISFPPRYAISTVVKTLKSVSARKLFREYPPCARGYGKENSGRMIILPEQLVMK